MLIRTLPLLLFLLPSLGCGRVSTAEAHKLVARYNQVVSEAYRKGDIKLIDAVVGPQAPDGKRLTGLIGVRQDLGIALDARLESLDVTAVEQDADELRVRTQERWRYRDVNPATGGQVGEASEDRYEMLYRFRRWKGAWMVEETRFTSQPQVGRKEVPWVMDAREAHAMVAPPVGEGGKR